MLMTKATHTKKIRLILLFLARLSWSVGLATETSSLFDVISLEAIDHFNGVRKLVLKQTFNKLSCAFTRPLKNNWFKSICQIYQKQLQQNLFLDLKIFWDHSIFFAGRKKLQGLVWLNIFKLVEDVAVVVVADAAVVVDAVVDVVVDDVADVAVDVVVAAVNVDVVVVAFSCCVFWSKVFLETKCWECKYFKGCGVGRVGLCALRYNETNFSRSSIFFSWLFLDRGFFIRYKYHTKLLHEVVCLSHLRAVGLTSSVDRIPL